MLTKIQSFEGDDIGMWVSGTLNQLVSDYGEEDLLYEMFYTLKGKGTEFAIKELTEEGYYVTEMVHKLGNNLPKGYTKTRLVEDVKGYVQEFVTWLTYAGDVSNLGEVLDDIMTMACFLGLDFLFYPEDELDVFRVLNKDLPYDTTKTFAFLMALDSIDSETEPETRDYIKKNFGRLYREHRYFSSISTSGNIYTYENFNEELEWEKGENAGNYKRESYKLLKGLGSKQQYVRYLELLGEKTESKGKEKAIARLAEMYPNKFKDVGDNKWVDLGSYYLTWLGSVRLISKKWNSGDFATEHYEVKSGSEQVILHWIAYNDLYKAFY